MFTGSPLWVVPDQVMETFAAPLHRVSGGLHVADRAADDEHAGKAAGVEGCRRRHFADAIVQDPASAQLRRSHQVRRGRHRRARVGRCQSSTNAWPTEPAATSQPNSSTLPRPRQVSIRSPPVPPLCPAASRRQRVAAQRQLARVAVTDQVQRLVALMLGQEGGHLVQAVAAAVENHHVRARLDAAGERLVAGDRVFDEEHLLRRSAETADGPETRAI